MKFARLRDSRRRRQERSSLSSKRNRIRASLDTHTIRKEKKIRSDCNDQQSLLPNIGIQNESGAMPAISDAGPNCSSDEFACNVISSLSTGPSRIPDAPALCLENDEDYPEIQQLNGPQNTDPNARRNTDTYNENNFGLRISNISSGRSSQGVDRRHSETYFQKNSGLTHGDSIEQDWDISSDDGQSFQSRSFSSRKTSEAPATVIEAVLSTQTKILGARKYPSLPASYHPTNSGSRGRQKTSRQLEEELSEGFDVQHEIRKNWAEQLDILRRMKPEFFKSEEAKMAIFAFSESGTANYEKLPPSHKNNADVCRVYEVCFEARIRNGFSKGSYVQFLVAIGQFARLCVAHNKLDITDLCEPGALFLQGRDLNIVRIFLNYFDIKGSASTVMSKAAHLKKFLQFAASSDACCTSNSSSSSIPLVIQYLTSVFNVKKRLSRDLASRNRSLNERIETRKILFPQDFSLCIKIAKKS